MAQVTNSVNANFIQDYNKLVKAGKTEEFRTLFDNDAAVEKDSNKDSKKNTDAIGSIKEAVDKGAKKPKAIENASEKAEKMTAKLEKGKEVKFMGLEVVSAKAKKNSNVVNVTVKDGGKEYKGTITYAADGSCVMQLKQGDTVTTKVVDKEGVTREKTVYDKKTKQTTTKEYDKTGKINKKTVTDANNKDYSAVTYYDDKGQAAKKVVNDGVTTKTSAYEYDKDGNKVGTYTEIVNNQTKEKTTKTAIIEGNTKTVTEVQPDGTVSTRTYERKDDKSDWALKTKDVQKKDAENKTSYEYGDKVVNKDGTATRNRKVTTQSGNVYYEVQTLNADGKVIGTKRYSDEEHKQQLNETSYELNSLGYKTKTTKNKMKDGKITETTQTSYDEKTGKIKDRTTQMFDTEGNVTHTATYGFDENNNVVSSTVTYKDDDGKEIVENRRFREDGSESFYENVTLGFSAYKNAAGAVNRMDFKDVSAENVKAHLPETAAANGGIPIFNENGAFAGVARYDEAGKFKEFEWQEGFGG